MMNVNREKKKENLNKTSFAKVRNLSFQTAALLLAQTLFKYKCKICPLVQLIHIRGACSQCWTQDRIWISFLQRQNQRTYLFHPFWKYSAGSDGTNLGR